jgi:HAD superfamily hydrolase (TIGR01549 family)
MKSGNPAILFDLDGTLVDTVYEHVLAWSDALRSAKIVVPNWKIHRRIGMSGKSLVHQLLREDDNLPRKADIGLLEKRHDSAFTKASRNVQLLPGSQELLDFLMRRGIRWAIATTGGRKATARLLKKLKIPANVPVVTGDDVTRAKPSPDVFMMAADRLDVPIGDCIVTGDSVWDVLAAARKRSLGVGFLSGGYGQEEPQVLTEPWFVFFLGIADLGLSSVRGH